MRRWVMHLPCDLRPGHFVFAPCIQASLLEVDQEVKRESFKEPFLAIWFDFHSLASSSMVIELVKIICLCARLI